MSTRSIVIPLAANQTGLTLSAQLFTTSGSASGSAITSGFAELGNGFYLWTGMSFPSQFRGAATILSAGAIVAALAINPEEAEDVGDLYSSGVEVASYASGQDPGTIVWNIPLPGSYPSSSAGSILGNALNAGTLVELAEGTVVASPSPTSTTFTAIGSTLNITSGGYQSSPMVALWQTGANATIKYPIAGHSVRFVNPTYYHDFTIANTMANVPQTGETFTIG
jgi:hypothetical protein